MIPAKTLKKIGQLQGRERFSSDHDYILPGSDLADLFALTVRFNSKMDDPDELRDWQNRISLMLMNASRC